MEPILKEIFSDLTDEALSDFTTLGYCSMLGKDELLCSPEVPPIGLTFIVEGKVAVEREHHRICVLETGSFFGEGTLVRDTTPNVTVFTIEPTKLFQIPYIKAREFLASRPDLGFSVVRTLLVKSMNRLETTNDLFSKNRALTLELEEKNKELKQTLARLSETQEQLLHAQRMASLGILVAGVAHEINNPLGAMLQSINTASERVKKINSEELAQSIAKPLKRAADNGERIQKIVQDLRNFARAERVKGESANLTNEIEAAIQILGEQAEKRNIRLLTTYNSAKYVEAPPTRLDQLLVNIIQNAIHASPDNSQIEIITGEQDSKAWVKIIDHGTGMTPEVKARIFDPFFTTKPVGVGTGLGLWICQSIVNSLGGSMDLETTPGVGTTFILTFNVSNHN